MTYTESDNSVAIKFSCAGRPYNPLAKEIDELDEENLSATILRGLAKNYSHEYGGGVNRINFNLA